MATNLFDGLEGLGLGNLKEETLYKGDQKTESDEAPKEAEAPAINEESLVFDRTYECYVCDNKFQSKAFRPGKLRNIGQDNDLRVKYDGAEPLKYNVISCPKCGYTALAKFFKPMARPHTQAIRDKISANFKGEVITTPIYTFEDAIKRYKLALVNCMVKGAKASEKAYTCLNAAWVCRSYREDVEKTDSNNSSKIQELNALENEFIKNAYEGFLQANESESFPICDMDENTFSYLLAVLAMKQEVYDVASKLIAILLGSKTCPSRIKDKALDLKTEILEKKKNS